MNQTPVIVFVCEHGAAKSIIASAYFNKIAGERKLNIHSVARGTNPDQELSAKTITGLHEDGLTPTESKPQQLSLTDLELSQRIITFCELPAEYQNKITIENWHDVPPVSENYESARDTILHHIEQLLK